MILLLEEWLLERIPRENHPKAFQSGNEIVPFAHAFNANDN